MAEFHELGEEGENLAKTYLEKKGFVMLEEKWSFGKNEIDLIARHNNKLIIIEVKTRSSSRYGQPYIAVNKAKQKILIKGANRYIEMHNIDKETRFDVVSIVLTPQNAILEHIEDAFYPTL